jgi:hypothetical protein
MKKVAESELVLNADGSVYHLHLRPEHIADTVITVGESLTAWKRFPSILIPLNLRHVNASLLLIPAY